jgi:HUS1 checkpoint protein
VSESCCPLQKPRNDAYGYRQVKVQSIFSDYRIQSNSNNEITILISPEALLLALRSAWNPASLDSTAETVMKLAKKNDQAALSFNISGSMSSGRMVRVGHDVRIEVMKPSDVKKLTEPMCPEPDVRYFTACSRSRDAEWFAMGQVHILLPPLQKLRTIVERLRPLSDVIAVRCNNNGKLQISVQTESVSVDTQWSGCTNPKMGEPSASPPPSHCSYDHSKRKRGLPRTRTLMPRLRSLILTISLACSYLSRVLSSS